MSLADNVTPEHRKMFQECVEKFVARDFDACAMEGLDLCNRAGASVQLVQLILISLQRAGNFDTLKAIGPSVVDAFGSQPWELGLIKLTLGQLQAQPLMEDAIDDVRRVQLFYYAGARRLTTGDVAGALVELRSAVDGEANCLEQALAAYDARLGDDMLKGVPGEFAAFDFSRRAVMLFHEGDVAAAAAVAMEFAAFPTDYWKYVHPEYLSVIGQVALALRAQVTKRAQAEPLIWAVHALQNSDQVEKVYRHAVEAARVIGGAQHPATPAYVSNLALYLMGVGRMNEAEAAFRETLHLRRALAGEESTDYAENLANLGAFYTHAGSFQKAKECYERTLEIRRRICPTDHGLIADNLKILAACSRRLGANDEARAFDVAAEELP